MKISHLSFGASSLGSVFRTTNEKESFEAVEAAIEGGINFIDVSPYYGHYKAETVLGKALRNIPRDKYYLSTKVGRYGKDGVNTWDYSAQRVTDSVYESMERLGIDHIDLINVHDIEFQAALPGGLQKVVDETLPALFALRDKGIVGHGCEGIESILNFCHYTLNDDALADYLDFFAQHGIGIINASPLSMGLLSQRGVPSWHPAPKALVEACQRAAELCQSRGYAIERLAVQYSVSNPRIASTLFSSANPDNVRRNIRWANEEPDWDLVREIKEIIGTQQRVTWANS